MCLKAIEVLIMLQLYYFNPEIQPKDAEPAIENKTKRFIA